MSLGEIVARNIRRIRRERGLSQEELASLVNINRNYIGMIERQENSPTVSMVERIARALNIEPTRLFEEKPVARMAD
jgi:transcriptional regulator with XRE-family HTH domain